MIKSTQKSTQKSTPKYTPPTDELRNKYEKKDHSRMYAQETFSSIPHYLLVWGHNFGKMDKGGGQNLKRICVVGIVESQRP